METITNRVYFDFKGRILIVGWGMVARASFLAVKNHFGIPISSFTIVTADENGKDIAMKEGISSEKFIVNPLTQTNYRQVLDPLLFRGDFLLNLSVDVSSVDLVELAQEKGCLYLDTCIEPWVGGYTDSSIDIGQRTNYALRERGLKLKEKYQKGSSNTSLLACGANPGMVSFLLKEALVKLARDVKLPNFEIPETREEWAELARSLNVKVIHIAERDTQSPIHPKQRGEFVNTWSVDGFISEGVFQPAELGWGSHEKELPPGAHTFETGCKSAIYLSKPGCETKMRSWTPEEGPYHGFMVTHNESVSIADYMTVKKDDVLVYRPTVHYVYHPCDAAIASLHEIMGKESEEQPVKRVVIDDIASGGMDELGLLICGHERGAMWYGSQLTVDDARKIAPYNSATSLQVVAGIIAGMVYCMEHPKEGIIEADDIEYSRAMDIARPYLGKVSGHYTDWTPLQNRKTGLFPQKQFLDTEDVWQFKNFYVV